MLRLHRPTASATPRLDDGLPSNATEERHATQGPAGFEDRPRSERRRFRRTPLNQRVSLGGAGLAPRADLIDGSASGLFLRIDGARRPEAGETVLVDFEGASRGGLARADSRRQANVVRCLSHAGAHYVAVCFATPDALRLPATSFG